MTRWAIFGGSFDPPHVGHVLAATWVLACGDVEAVIVVPTFEHPFGKPLTDFPHRRRMLELAFAPLRRVTISDVEARLGGASYTVRTLEAIRQRSPGVELVLMVGSDLVAQLPTWRDAERLEGLARVLVVGRGGHAARALAMPEVSSSEVRERLARGEPVDGLVPHAVLRYIERYGLYRR